MRQAQYARTLSVICVLCGHMAECGTGTWCIVEWTCGRCWSSPECGRPGILHHQLQRNTTASSPRPGALAEYVLTHSGSITPRDIRQLLLPHPCRGTLWRPRLGRVRHVTALAVWPGGGRLCGPPLVCGPPGGRAGAGAGGLARGRDRGPPRCVPRTSDQGALETVWTQRMRGGR